jgi:hypothetical protein
MFDIDALSDGIPNRSNLLLSWYVFVFLYFHLLGHVSQITMASFIYKHPQFDFNLLANLQTSSHLLFNHRCGQTFIEICSRVTISVVQFLIFLQEPLGLGLGNTFKN